MKVLAILNPENGTCKETLSLLFDLSQKGYEVKEILLALGNTYHAERWVMSLSMPLSKEEIESIKERYYKKVLTEWEALGGNEVPIKVEVNEAPNLLKEENLNVIDLLVVGCLESKSLCKLIETLDKPVLVVKN